MFTFWLCRLFPFKGSIHPSPAPKQKKPGAFRQNFRTENKAFVPSYYRLNDMMLPSSGSCSSVREAQEVGNRQQMGLQTGEDGVSVVWVIGFRKKSLGIGKNAYKMLRNQRMTHEVRNEFAIHWYLEDLGPLGVRGKWWAIFCYGWPLFANDDQRGFPVVWGAPVWWKFWDWQAKPKLRSFTLERDQK